MMISCCARPFRSLVRSERSSKSCRKGNAIPSTTTSRT